MYAIKRVVIFATMSRPTGLFIDLNRLPKKNMMRRSHWSWV